MSPAQVSPVPAANVLDILLAHGTISREQYDKVKLEALGSAVPAEQLLLTHNFVSLEAVVRAKGELYNIPYISLNEQAASPEAITSITEFFARRFNIFPIALDKQLHQLTVVMENPLDLAAIEFLEKKSGFKIKPIPSPARL